MVNVVKILTMNRAKLRSLLPFVAGAILLVIVGFIIGSFIHNHEDIAYKSVREQSSEYRFINPLLFVEISEDSSFPEYRSLKDSILNYVEQAKNEGKIKEAAVYFRNLNTSQWVGINPDQHFDPASMLKVATMIALLREAEMDSGFLSGTVVAQVPEEFSWRHQKSYTPEHPIENGTVYSVSTLLSHLIIESDNSANYMLNRVLKQENIHRVYDHLRLPRLTEAPNGYSPREYSVLYRALYNGTYLSKHFSEEALELLSNSTFKVGLVAGVPDDTLVAHKFGVRDAAANPLEGSIYEELHDCGIVYYPDHPYFLCVMTRGEDRAVLESIIAGISKTTWDEVNALHTGFAF